MRTTKLVQTIQTLINMILGFIAVIVVAVIVGLPHGKYQVKVCGTILCSALSNYGFATLLAAAHTQERPLSAVREGQVEVELDSS